MNLILLGPPGAGKGTQAKFVSEKYKIPHISTGDMFRETAQSGSELGRKLQEFMTSGKLVTDEIVIGVVETRLAKQDTAKGFLLDGFPRTVSQAQSLDRILSDKNHKIDAVLSITLADEEVIKRLSSRRVCVACGASYNTITQPPRADNICDKCKGKVIQRQDDNAQTIRQRLKVYNEQTSPLIEYYTKEGILKVVDGSGSVEAVFKGLCEFIEK